MEINYNILNKLKKNITDKFIRNFKQKHSFEERIKESKRLRLRFPDKIPIIVENDFYTNLHIVKNKFIVPIDINISQFMYIIRKQFKIEQNFALYMSINGIIPASNSLVNNIYHEYKDQDNYLYVILKTESTFG